MHQEFGSTLVQFTYIFKDDRFSFHNEVENNKEQGRATSVTWLFLAALYQLYALPSDLLDDETTVENG